MAVEEAVRPSDDSAGGACGSGERHRREDEDFQEPKGEGDEICMPELDEQDRRGAFEERAPPCLEGISAEGALSLERDGRAVVQQARMVSGPARLSAREQDIAAHFP